MRAPPDPSAILIVRLSAIGDTVLTTPVARQLRRKYPDARIAWLVGRKAYPVVAANPHVDETIVLDDRNPFSWLNTIRRICRRYDLVIDVQSLLKTRVLTWLSRAPVRLGRETARHRSSWAYTEVIPRRPDESFDYVAQIYLHQCQGLGADLEDYQTEFEPAPRDREWAASRWQAEGLDAARCVVALIPFASVASNEWSPDRFAAVADRLGEEFGARSVILGSAAERPRAEELAERMNSEPAIVAGETSLGQAVAAIERCSLAIGGDTGLMHCTFARRVPLVCILGASPLVNGPKGERAVCLQSPCDHRPCPKDTPCQRGEGRPCLDEVTVEQVLEASRELLAAG